MADYEKVFLRAVFSANSDYSQAKRDTDAIEVEATPSYVKHDELTVPTGGMTLIEAGEWTTLDTLAVKNEDSSNFITVGYTDAASDAQTIDVLAGDIFVTMDVDPATAVTLTADTAACDTIVYASGS